MRNYIIKVWETEDEREQGLSEILKVGIENVDNAIEQARKIKEENEYVCVEVQDSKEKKSYCTLDNEGEKIDKSNYKDAVRQEKVNYFFNLVYGSIEENVYDDADVLGKASNVAKELKENEESIYEDYEDDPDIKKEFKELLEDIEEYDSEDIIKIYEHPMAVIPMVDSEKRVLEDLATTFLDMVEDEEIVDYKIKDIVDAYIYSNDISDFMEYGADRDTPNMQTFSKVYRDIMIILNIDYEDIYTNEIRGGKYETVIEFGNNNSITVDTYSRNGQTHIAENMESIKEFENSLDLVEDDEMEM